MTTSASSQAAAAAAAAHQAELAREAEQRREAELARERAAAQAREHEEMEARAAAQARAQQAHEHEQQAHEQQAHQAAAGKQLDDTNRSAVLGGMSAVGGTTTANGQKRTGPVDPAVDKEFNQLAAHDGNNKTKLAHDADQLMMKSSSGPTIGLAYEQVVTDASKHGVLAKTLDGLGSGAGGAFGSSFAQDEASVGLSLAIRNGSLNGASVVKSLTADSRNQLSQQYARNIAQDSVHQVNDAKQALDSQTSKKDQLDQRLATELAKIGPGITPQQRDQYIQSFKQKNNYSKLENQIDQAATSLDTTLKQQKPTLDAMMSIGGPKLDPNTPDAGFSQGKLPPKTIADATTGALKDLAGTNKAGDALKMSAQTLQDKNLTSQMMKADPEGFKQSMNSIAEQALPTFGKQLLDQAAQKRLQSAGKGAKTDPKEAEAENKNVLAQLKEVMDPFKEAHEVFGDTNKLGQAYKAVNDAANGKLSALQDLGKAWEKEAPSGTERAFAGLGILFGANDGLTGELGKSFQGTLETFKDSSEGIATLGDSFSALKGVGKVAGVADRFAPAAGVVLNAIATGKDLKDVLNAKNAGDGIGSGVQLAGDLLSTIGSGLEATGVGVVPGALVDAAGTVVSFIGGGIKSLFGGGGQSPDDETKQLLTKNLHMSSQTAGGLVGAQPGVLKQLQGKGMNAGQVDDIVTNYSAITNGNNPYALGEVEDVQKAFGVKDKNFDAMLHTVGGDWQQRLGSGGYHTDQSTAFGNFVNFISNANGYHEAQYYAGQAGPQGSPAYEKVFGDDLVGNDRYLESDLDKLR